MLRALGSSRQRGEEVEARRVAPACFGEGVAGEGAIPGRLPRRGRADAVARRRQMLRKQLGLARRDRRELLVEHASDRSVELAAALEERLGRLQAPSFFTERFALPRYREWRRAAIVTVPVFEDLGQVARLRG